MRVPDVPSAGGDLDRLLVLAGDRLRGIFRLRPSPLIAAPTAVVKLGSEFFFAGFAKITLTLI